MFSFLEFLIPAKSSVLYLFFKDFRRKINHVFKEFRVHIDFSLNKKSCRIVEQKNVWAP